MVCCDCRERAVVYRQMYGINLRKPTGSITVLRETRSAQCVLVKPSLSFTLLLYIPVNTTTIQYNANATCFDLQQSSSDYAKNRYCFTGWLFFLFPNSIFIFVFYFHYCSTCFLLCLVKLFNTTVITVLNCIVFLLN